MAHQWYFSVYPNPCSVGYIYCNNTDKCVRAAYRCDGDNDCGDNEDETNCRKFIVQ